MAQHHSAPGGLRVFDEDLLDRDNNWEDLNAAHRVTICLIDLVSV